MFQLSSLEKIKVIPYTLRWVSNHIVLENIWEIWKFFLKGENTKRFYRTSKGKQRLFPHHPVDTILNSFNIFLVNIELYDSNASLLKVTCFFINAKI